MLAAALGPALKELHVKSGRVVFGIADPSALVMTLTIPRLSRADTGAVLAKEVERRTPVPVHQLHYEWTVVRANKETQDVLLVVTLKYPGEAGATALEAAGLKPAYATNRGLAIARTLRQPSAVLVHVEEDSFDLVFVRRHVPMFIGTVFHGMAEPPAAEWYLEAIREEWARALEGLPQGFKNDLASGKAPVVVTGAAASDGRLEAMLKQAVASNVVPFEPRFHTPRGFPAPQYAAGLGLALASEEKPGGLRLFGSGGRLVCPRLDLAPKVVVTRSIRTAQVLAAGGVLLCLALAFPFYTSVASAKRDADALADGVVTTERAARLRAEIARKAIVTTQELKTTDSQAQALSAKTVGVSTGAQSASPALAALLATGPALQLGSVGLDQGKGTLTGTAASSAAVYRYVEQLRAGGVFSNVALNSVKLSPSPGGGGQAAGGNYTFTLSVTR